MNSNTKEIPDFLKHLPVFRGFPIPYFVPKDEHGVYQLKYADGGKMQSCIKYHKCCVCFKPLAIGDYWFISGPLGLQNQTDSHPPMHKQCAEYSLQICPHLFFEKTHRTTEDSGEKYQIRKKPKELFLVQANKYDAIYPDKQHLVIKYKQATVKDHFIYSDGILKSTNQ